MLIVFGCCIMPRCGVWRYDMLRCAVLWRYILHYVMMLIWCFLGLLPDLMLEERDSSDSPGDNDADSSSGSKYQMKAPCEEDFDYIKQISNGAYGLVNNCVVTALTVTVTAFWLHFGCIVTVLWLLLLHYDYVVTVLWLCCDCIMTALWLCWQGGVAG